MAQYHVHFLEESCFSCCLFAGPLNVPRAGSWIISWVQDASLIPKTHTRRAPREFQFCLRHAWAVSYAGFICCQIPKRAERHGVFVSCAVRSTAYVTQHVISGTVKKRKTLICKEPKDYDITCLIFNRERQPCVFTSVLFYRMLIRRPVLLSGGHVAPRSGGTLRRHALRPVLL